MPPTHALTYMPTHASTHMPTHTYPHIRAPTAHRTLSRPTLGLFSTLCSCRQECSHLALPRFQVCNGSEQPRKQQRSDLNGPSDNNNLPEVTVWGGAFWWGRAGGAGGGGCPPSSAFGWLGVPEQVEEVRAAGPARADLHHTCSHIGRGRLGGRRRPQTGSNRLIPPMV